VKFRGHAGTKKGGEQKISFWFFTAYYENEKGKGAYLAPSHLMNYSNIISKRKGRVTCEVPRRVCVVIY